MNDRAFVLPKGKKHFIQIYITEYYVLKITLKAIHSDYLVKYNFFFQSKF